MTTKSASERERMFDERARAMGPGIKPTPPRTTCNSTMQAHYQGSELSAPSVRIGADDHMAVPSLRFGKRHLRDGRVTK